MKKISRIAGAISLSTILTIATPVAGLSGYYFGKQFEQNEKINNVTQQADAKIAALDSRVAVQETHTANVEKQLDSMDGKLDALIKAIIKSKTQ